MVDRSLLVPVSQHNQFKNANQILQKIYSEIESFKENKKNIDMLCDSLDAFISILGHIQEEDIINSLVTCICELGCSALGNINNIKYEGLFQRIFEIGLICIRFNDIFLTALNEKKVIEKHDLKCFTNFHGADFINNFVYHSDLIFLSKEYLKVKNSLLMTRADVAAICLSHSLSTDIQYADFIEKVKSNVIFFVIYVFIKNEKKECFLELWSQLKTENIIDLKLLGLHEINLTNFFIKEIDKIENIQTIESMVKNLGSHKIVYDLFHKVHLSSNLSEILIHTFNIEEEDFTKQIFEKMFLENPKNSENILKRFIIDTRSMSYVNLFFEKCNVVDGNFIEVCNLYSQDIEKISESSLFAIIESHYVSFLTNELDIFKKLMKKLHKFIYQSANSNYKEKIVDEACHKLFYNNLHVNENIFKKFSYFLGLFPNKTSILCKYFLDLLKSIDLKVYKENSIYTNDLLNLSLDTRDVSSKFLKSQSILFFKIVSMFRAESKICEYIPLFIELDSFTFFKEVLFKPIERIDIFFIKSIDYSIKNFNELQSKEIFIECLLQFRPLSKNENYFWNVILRKNINFQELLNNSLFNQFLGKKAQTSNISSNNFNSLEKPFKSPLKNIDERKVKNEQIIQKDGFYEKTLPFYDHDLIIERIFFELKLEKRNYILLSSLLKRLENENKYVEGLVFSSSEVILNRKMCDFCFYAIFYQYDYFANQELFSFQGLNASCTISLFNGKLVKRTEKNGENETFLFNENQRYTSKMAIGVSVSKNRAELYINNFTYVFKVPEVHSLRIGKNFKGIINRILWYENLSFSMKFLSNINRSKYYVECISDLEKLLIFNNHSGVYIDTLKPFFISGCEFEIVMKNVFINNNFYWLDNNLLRNTLIEEAENDANVKKMVENCIMANSNNISY